jgi:hypothetical protein
MELRIHVPTRAQIVNGGFPVSVAVGGASWSKSQLGAYADAKGVYIHHCNGKILYVGKTTEGDYGTFGERLRREFQTKASSDSALHRLLAAQREGIRTYLLDLEDLDMMVDPGPMELKRERKALIMEQVLIGLFRPEGNKI